MIGMSTTSHQSDNLRRFNWTAAAVQWADTIGPIGRTALQQRAPRSKPQPGSGRRSGRFAKSIRYDRTTRPGLSVQARWTANTPYARYVIEPTKAHIIRARAARTLRFKNKAGKWVFPKQVRHPGTKGTDFHLRTMRHYKPIAQDAYTRIMRDALGGM
jgi:hypothetical protein